MASVPICLILIQLEQTLGFYDCSPEKPLRKRIMRTSTPRKRRKIQREMIQNRSLKMTQNQRQMIMKFFS
ncbi:hypothetical protein RIF29_32103 [Crotalaria pallida]|uniref:Uncharacterized protein n=1 Tax=Crotalaria pallida TaxID=3830 RepID=A0AAN9EK35_CROPI